MVFRCKGKCSHEKNRARDPYRTGYRRCIKVGIREMMRCFKCGGKGVKDGESCIPCKGTGKLPLNLDKVKKWR